MMKRKIVRSGYDIESAKNMLWQLDRNINIIEVDEVFYPYVMLWYSIHVGKGRFSKLNKFLNCIVDGVSGSAYEGKGTPAMIDIEMEEKNSLALQVTLDRCHEIGHDFVMKQFLGKAKLLITPAIKVMTEEIFYKRFYIMRCLDEEARNYFIMVDAIDGGLSVLDC
ncbi:MAG: hypothetical protein K0R19_1657 [Bacillota bacterium]|jgi:hypothetical protein|nr:hypothetical protein [Bacillota bacterium]